MKKSVIFVALFLVLLTSVSAEICNLNVKLMNQDPYPATPNDYVEVVFQMTGIENPECGEVSFQLKEEFPFKIEGENFKTIKGGSLIDYRTYWLIPYKILIDKDAINKKTEIEARFSSLKNNQTQIKKKFNITIEDPRADFEVHVDDYSYSTKELTLEILNIEDVDIEALTVEIPEQTGVDVRGANRMVVGDLDANEFTTATFKANMDTDAFNITILYTDEIGVRRTLEKTVQFDADLFMLRDSEKSSTPIGYYIALILVIALIIWIIVRKRKKKKERIMRKHGGARL